MALVERITNVDTSGMTQGNLDLLLKGIAHHEGIHNEDGTIDISVPATVNTAWKNKQVNILRSWAKDAQAYEDKLAGYTDIVDA